MCKMRAPGVLRRFTESSAARVNFVLCVFASLAVPAAAEPACRRIEEAGARYTLCAFDARKAAIRVFLRDRGGEVLGSFTRLGQSCRPAARRWPLR